MDKDENNLTNVNKLQGIVLIMSAHCIHRQFIYMFANLPIHYTTTFLCAFSRTAIWEVGWESFHSVSARPSSSVVRPSIATNWRARVQGERALHTHKMSKISREQFPSSECKHGHYSSPLPRLSFEQCFDVPSYQISEREERPRFMFDVGGIVWSSFSEQIDHWFILFFHVFNSIK